MTAPKNAFTYIAKLLSFALICSILGVLALIYFFAPATNPSFLNAALFRGNHPKDLQDLITVSDLFTEGQESARILRKLAQPQSPDEIEKLGLTAPEIVQFKSGDGANLNGWFFPNKGPDTILVAYNGFGKRLPLLTGYVPLLKSTGASIFFFDYRALNDPTTKITPRLACADAQAAYDYLIRERKIKPENLILLGREIGCYAVLKIAASNKCKALILEEPWTDVKAASEAVPGAIAMRLVPQFLYTEDALNNIHLVGQKHPPILVLSSEPNVSRAEDFYNQISEPKSYQYIDGYRPAMLAPDLTVSHERYEASLKNLLAGLPIKTTRGVVNWRSDYDSALAEARQQSKPLLIVFSADWCQPCQTMASTTYSDLQVCTELNKSFVPVHLDMDKEPAIRLGRSFGITGVPTAIVLSAKDQSLKNRMDGFSGPDRYLKWLKKAAQ
ncbi:MAG: thioredoxin family protein [Cyanobacteria bacterium REEB67]|nr:thioredoxin family protein [Cyanobacteria bacterium REEB67]